MLDWEAQACQLRFPSICLPVFLFFFGRVIGQVYSSLVADRGGIGLMPGQTMLLAGMSRVWGF